MGLIATNCGTKDKFLSKLYPTFLDTRNSQFLLIDKMYVSSFLVVDYAKEMEGGFLEKILSSGIDLNISLFYEKQDSNEIIKKITYQLGNTGSDIKNSNENQMDMDIMSKTYKDAKYIRSQMLIEGEEFYYLYIYISVYSNSKKNLEINIKKIENIASSAGLTLLRANFKQEQSFLSSLPFLKNDKLLKKITKRNVLTDGVSSTYPFLSSELCDEDGIFIGTSEFNHSLVLVDRFDSERYKNANMFIIGTSGSGKSYFTKLMVARNRYLDISQYIVDPDREYTKICEKLGGTLIDFKKQTINILDIRESTREDNDGFLENKLGKLKAFFENVFKDMTSEESSYLEENIIECYKNKGITFDDESLYIEKEGKKKFKQSRDMPILKDLYDLIKKDKRLRRLTALLRPYINGSTKFLNNYTNVDLNNKIVVSDVYGIEEKDLATVMYIITEFYWDVIKESRAQKKILYLDEVWRLINSNHETASFVFKVFKTIRKYGGAATAITQDINDFFALDEGKFGKGIINNSSIKCIFQLEESDVRNLEKIINISENEKQKVQSMKRGTCLMYAGREHIVVNVEASKLEHEFITTDRKDIKD